MATPPPPSCPDGETTQCFLKLGGLCLLHPVSWGPPSLSWVPLQLQDDLEPLALALGPAPASAPRPPQDLIGLRLAQEKALKRQLEEEQKLKPTGVGAPAASSSMPAVVTAARTGPTPTEEAMEYREEGPECETPAIFISMDDDSGLAETTLLDSSLEGSLPKVGGQLKLQREAGAERAPGVGLTGS